MINENELKKLKQAQTIEEVENLFKEFGGQWRWSWDNGKFIVKLYYQFEDDIEIDFEELSQLNHLYKGDEK